MAIIDGREIAKLLQAKIKDEVAQMRKPPCLCVVLAGSNESSSIYVKNKQKACEQVGIFSTVANLLNPTEEEILELIYDWNESPDCDGILVQLPLPSTFNKASTLGVLNAVSSFKDVDGFHINNLGCLTQTEECFVPCTPSAILRILNHYNIKVVGKHVVIINDTIVVGRPLAMMLLNRDATVTLCNSKTENIEEIAKSADILVSAVGRREKFVVTAEMVKPKAVVIDVGISRVNNRIVGDVDFEKVAEKASWITPVPGGVGPMTVACLLDNTLKAARKPFKH